MIDTEKIINALENCTQYNDACINCEYNKHVTCKTSLMIDALALLKKQKEEIENHYPELIKKQDDMISITTVAEYLADNAPPPLTVQHWESVMAWERFLLSLKGRKIRND